MAAFADTGELLQFAQTFLGDRTYSLERGALVCIHADTPALPGFLYCFAMIDLLGALLAGDAKSSLVTDRAKAYARRFMHDSVDQCELLWGVFHHKLVHLAQPKPVKLVKGKTTMWTYWHDGPEHHLRVRPLIFPSREPRASGLVIETEQWFEISVRHLVADIVHSVYTTDGYLDALASDASLQEKFTKAVTEIYEP